VTGTVQRHGVLLVSVAGAMIVAMDGTILIVAQPSLGRDLGANVAQVQWTSTGYLLAVASLLVIAGRLGDRYGHTRLLLAGIALAPGVGWVIGLRTVQGVFGALLQPATLALLRLAYPADRLGTAIAIRTGAIGVAAATGPVLGGALVAHLGWRTVFVVNVPVALAIAALTFAVRPPAPSPAEPSRIDLTSAALLAAGLAVLVHTVVGVPSRGWVATPTLLGFGAAIGVAAVLVRHERRAPHPIVPPVVARSTAVMASMAILVRHGDGHHDRDRRRRRAGWVRRRRGRAQADRDEHRPGVRHHDRGHPDVAGPVRGRGRGEGTGRGGPGRTHRPRPAAGLTPAVPPVAGHTTDPGDATWQVIDRMTPSRRILAHDDHHPRTAGR
jgi:hypothetical protein